jgi:hypothetical protein
MEAQTLMNGLRAVADEAAAAERAKVVAMALKMAGDLRAIALVPASYANAEAIALEKFAACVEALAHHEGE